MKKETVQTIKTIILALIIAATANLVSADWLSPPSNPPAGNVDAPINVGVKTQQKLGPLWVNTNTTGSVAAVGLSVWGNSAKPIRIVDSDLTSQTPQNHDGWVLTSDAQGYGSWKSISAATQPHGTFIDTTPGTRSWSIPANVSSIEVEVIGGGGGGAYHGGAGGGYAYKRMNVSGSSITYTVGSGGSGSGPYGNAGSPCMLVNWDQPNQATAGTASTFNSTVTAGGGGGGNYNSGTTPSPGTWSGGDWGASGKDAWSAPNFDKHGDRPIGYPSGYPLSTGAYVNASNVIVAGTFGGGGNGDSDTGDNRACGSNGAPGAIIIKY